MTKKAKEAAADTYGAAKARWDATAPSTKTTRSGDGTAPESPIWAAVEKAKDALRSRYFEIEARADLSDDQKVSEVIKITAAVCAGVAVQPIPFADFFVLTPIQILMGSRIAAIRGYPVSDHQIGEILKELAGAVGLGVLAQQLAIGAYKTFIPFLGAITTIPIVFGLTYGIGRIFDEYFIRKRRGQVIDPERLKDIFKRARAEGRSAAKSEESERTTLRTETPSD